MGSETAWSVVGTGSKTHDGAGAVARADAIAAGEWLATQIPANVSGPGSREHAEDFDQLRTRLIAVSDRLHRVEERAYPETSRGTVQQLRQDLSCLGDDLVRATGHSAIQVSALSAELQSLTGRLDAVRAESSKSIRRCLTLLRQGLGAVNARQADAPASIAGDLAAVVSKLDDVRARATDSFAALDRRLVLTRQNIERLDHRYGQTPQTLSRNFSPVSGGIDEAEAEASLAAGALQSCLERVGQTLEQLEHRYRRTAQTVSDDLSALADRLDVVRWEALEAVGALDARLTAADQTLEHLDHPHDETAQTLAGSISSLGGKLDAVLVVAAKASAALEQRLTQIAARSDERHAASKDEQEALGRRLDEARAEAALAAGTLEARLSVVNQTVEHLDHHRDEAGKTAAGALAALAARVDAARTEAAQTSAGLEQGFARLGARTGQQHASLDERLEALRTEASQAAATVAGRFATVDRTLEHLDRRQSETAQTARRSAGDLSILGGTLEETRSAGAKAFADWEERLARNANDSLDRHTALKAEQDGLGARLDETRAEAAQAAGAVGSRLAAMGQTLEHLAHRQDETAQTAAAREQRIAHMQSQIDALHARHGEISQHLAAAQEREARMSALVSRLELNLANLESHVFEPASEARIASLERKVLELARPAEAATPAPASRPGPDRDQPIAPLPAIEAGQRAVPDEAAGPVRGSDDVPDRAVAEHEHLESAGHAQAAAAESGTHEPLLPAAPASDLPPLVGPEQAAMISAGIAGDPIADLPPFPEFAAPDAEDTPPISADGANAPTVPDPVPGSSKDFLAAARRSIQATEDRAAKTRADSLGRALLPAQIFATRTGRMAGALAGVVLLAAAAFGLNAFLKGSTAAGNRPVIPTSGQTLAQGTQPGVQPSAPAGAQVHDTASERPPMAALAGAVRGKSAVFSAPSSQSSPDVHPEATTPHVTANSADLSRIQSRAVSGDARAQLILGLYDLRGESDHAKTAQAAKWLELAAMHGEPIAQYRLGTMYAKGVGVPADATKAFHWYEAAAESGNRKAMQNLALDCVQGHGTTKNLPQAVRWFTHAAELGLVDAQFNLAVLHEQGLGVALSLRDAYQWFGIAAKYGDQESKGRIAALSSQISDDERAAAQKAIADFRLSRMDAHANLVPELPSTG